MLNPAQRLPRPLLILYQAESYVLVAMLAEAYAGADGYFGFS